MRLFTDSETLTAYRTFLGQSKSELAREMRTTPTSVSRWESDHEEVSPRAMAYLKKAVMEKLRDDLPRVLSEMIPKLELSEFVDLFGLADYQLSEDAEGRKYVGLILIGKYREHNFRFSMDDGKLYAIGRDNSATLATREFIDSIRKKARKMTPS